MKNTKIAARYAKALLDLALEKQLLDKVMADMQLLAKVTLENRDFRLLLESPVIRADKKMAVLRAIFADKFDQLSMNFLLILTNKRREMHIGIIASEFIRIYKEYMGIKTAFLTTAIPADEALKQKVIKMLENYTGKQIELEEVIDPAIIGGFIIKMDDLLYDSSLEYEFNKLRKEFQENIYVKGF